MPPSQQRIVIVGGGAGGLELVTRLGRKLGRAGLAEITLVDANRTHIWKPLLHEVAAGTLDSHEDELEYLAQAATCGFRFKLGRMIGLDRERKEIRVAATCNQDGEEIIPERVIPYDILVIAVGSVSNDFNVPGVQQHCHFLDTTQQAEAFQTRLLEAYLKAHTQGKPLEAGQLDVAIAGAGATGGEEAASGSAVQARVAGDDVVHNHSIRPTQLDAAAPTHGLELDALEGQARAVVVQVDVERPAEAPVPVIGEREIRVRGGPETVATERHVQDGERGARGLELVPDRGAAGPLDRETADRAFEPPRIASRARERKPNGAPSTTSGA